MLAEREVVLKSHCCACTAVGRKPSDNTNSMTEKIYIHIVDGTDAWISVDTEQLTDNDFLIKTFSDFDPDDTSFVPQFIPGDVVTRKIREKGNDKYWTADKLIRASDHRDKVYLEFLHRVVTGDKPKDEDERQKYSEAITRTRKEINEGKFHYPTIVNYISGVEL